MVGKSSEKDEFLIFFSLKFGSEFAEVLGSREWKRLLRKHEHQELSDYKRVKALIQMRTSGVFVCLHGKF